MYEAVNYIVILIIVMVFIIVKLIQIDRTLRIQNEHLAQIAGNLERLIVTVDNRTKPDE